MRFESGSSLTQSRPVDVYLGFEIYQEAEDRFVAVPQGWAGGEENQLHAPDLPSLRKKIWDWWHNILD